ncbi:MAG: hypothetical protein IPK13_09705 [Deltaproteobacteria bacterium]|nr:hypothetical protein [Deltaproteobacteria bacterium]
MTSEPETQKICFPCQSCGANLEFDPSRQGLQCPYCSHEQSVDRDVERPIVEYSFEAALACAGRRKARELMPQAVEVRCKGCGAKVVLDVQARRCAFCDSPLVAEPTDDELLSPESLLPFAVDEDDAKRRFVAWLASRWFAPSDLARRARRDGLEGVYLPYWTYDSNTTTRYSGMRGEHYYVTVSYNDSNGKRQTRRERRTRWWPESGTVHVPFDDVLIAATASLPRPLLRALEPWDLAALEPYQPGYLSGFLAERYGVDLEAGFDLAEARMDPQIRSAIRRDIGGDTQRILSMQVRHDDVRFKHLLLPIWLSSIRYRERVFRVLVNARTGEVVGERPYSWFKILGATVLVLGVGLLIYWLANR